MPTTLPSPRLKIGEPLALLLLITSGFPVIRPQFWTGSTPALFPLSREETGDKLLAHA